MLFGVLKFQGYHQASTTKSPSGELPGRWASTCLRVLVAAFSTPRGAWGTHGFLLVFARLLSRKWSRFQLRGRLHLETLRLCISVYPVLASGFLFPSLGVPAVLGDLLLCGGLL